MDECHLMMFKRRNTFFAFYALHWRSKYRGFENVIDEAIWNFQFFFHLIPKVVFLFPISKTVPELVNVMLQDFFHTFNIIDNYLNLNIMDMLYSTINFCHLWWKNFLAVLISKVLLISWSWIFLLFSIYVCLLQKCF